MDALTERLVSEFPRMPPRLQTAARFLIDQPQDVALLSMREQARRAGVPAATMTRLARHLGLAGYEEIRRSYAAAVRKSAIGYGEKASRLVTARSAEGPQAIIAEMAQALARHVAAFAEPERASRLGAAAGALAQAPRMFCLGLRSSFPIAFTFHYICALAGRPVTLLDAAGGTGADALAAAGAGHALLVVSVKPYTRLTIEAAQHAKHRNLSLVAITDSVVSPLAPLADHVIVVDTSSPSFFDAKTAALAAAEILAMLVTIQGGEQALSAVTAREHYLASVNAYWRPKSRKAR